MGVGSSDVGGSRRRGPSIVDHGPLGSHASFGGPSPTDTGVFLDPGPWGRIADESARRLLRSGHPPGAAERILDKWSTTRNLAARASTGRLNVRTGCCWNPMVLQGPAIVFSLVVYVAGLGVAQLDSQTSPAVGAIRHPRRRNATCAQGRDASSPLMARTQTYPACRQKTRSFRLPPHWATDPQAEGGLLDGPGANSKLP
jgi:hypothetical protein